MSETQSKPLSAKRLCQTKLTGTEEFIGSDSIGIFLSMMDRDFARDTNLRLIAESIPRNCTGLKTTARPGTARPGPFTLTTFQAQPVVSPSKLKSGPARSGPVRPVHVTYLVLQTLVPEILNTI